MMTGVYWGEIDDLRGQKALLQDVPGSDSVKAQFDSFDARRRGVDLSHGWHLFRRAEFEVASLVNWDDEPRLS